LLYKCFTFCNLLARKIKTSFNFRSLAYYKLLIIFTAFLFLGAPAFAYGEGIVQPIDAQNNAQMHNNQGVLYLRERDYLAAIKEFKIAIAINPKTQASATYYNNLGCAYLEIAKLQSTHANLKKEGDFAHFAQISFEDAIKLDGMNLTFYKNLVDTFYYQGTMNKSYLKYRDSKNDFDKIIVGFIHQKQGRTEAAKTVFDEFVSQNPNLLISKSLAQYIQ